MKCRKLLIIGLSTLALSMTVNLTTLSACGPGSSSDGGGQSSGNNGSNGNNDAGSGGNAGRAGGEATQDTQSSDANGNGPSNYQLIDCSNPVFYDFSPCFEQMVKSRENFVSQPKGE